MLVANELHKKGYNVIGTSLNPEKNQSSLPFKILALDITDDKNLNIKYRSVELKEKTILITGGTAGVGLESH